MPVDEIEKDPDAFTGTCVHMWGYIVQWDANTGACSFRAELAGRYYQEWFEYDGNNYLAAGDLDSCPELDGIDNNDFIEFWATGQGPSLTTRPSAAQPPQHCGQSRRSLSSRKNDPFHETRRAVKLWLLRPGLAHL